MDPKGRVDLRALLVLQELMDPKGLKDLQVHREDPADPQDLRDNMAVVVYLGKKVIRERKGTPVQKVFKGLKVRRETKVYKDLKGPKDRMVLRD